MNIIEAVSALKQDASSPSFLLQLDQQKAFNRVNHTYLTMVLKAFGLPHTFINISNQIFHQQTANITDNKSLSRSFRLGRGVRQGDPLSPILFALAIEPLLASLSASPYQINSILDNNQAFADDTTILVKNLIHLNEIETKIACYEKASNAKSNPNKSTLLPLTRIAREEANTNNNLKKYNIMKEKGKLTILGYHFNSDFQMHPTT